MGQAPARNSDGHENRIHIEPQDFTPDEIPEQLQDDVLAQYLRCRYNDRDAFLLDLRPDERRKVECEIKRIVSLRETYLSIEENRWVVHDLKVSRAAWKIYAKANSRESLDNVFNRVDTMKRIRRPEERHRREQLERNILLVVNGWNTEPYELYPPRVIEGNYGTSPYPKLGLFSFLAKRLGKTYPKKDDSMKKRPESEFFNDRKPQRPRPPDSYGISVSKITLKKSPDSSSYMAYDMEKYPLIDVLHKEEDNPLRRMASTDNPNMIRYFHFPSNDMHWIEEAIGRYYNEKTPGEYNWRAAPNYRKMSSNLLCREHWSSLQLGGKYDPIHARRMRAHCSLIVPEGVGEPENNPSNKNFVIFMPYLHWETNKIGKQMARVTREFTARRLNDSSYRTMILREELIKAAKEVHMARAMPALHAPKETKHLDNEDKKKGQGLLGKYLLQIAKLYDAMDIESDVRVLRDTLHQESPVHPRRTLDQSYYWKLQNTDSRDEDQVVFRATKEGKSIFRTTKIVMVDQLWLYILDENTIISSFPRRWGYNRPDYSDVHNSICAVLDHPRLGQFESVYDLALLIINQCSNVFFDRTKPQNEKPELLDIFSNALNHLSGMKTIAFEAFWRHLDKLSESERQRIDLEATARKYLNINPEGKILKEAQDIIDELRIMMSLFAQQKTVAVDFTEHLRNLHEQESKYHSNIAANLETMNPVSGIGLQQHSNVLNSLTRSAITENTLRHAKKVVNDILWRRSELEELQEDTSSIIDQLKDLLSLKEQQLGIMEVKLALQQADESIKQGRSVVLFTIVTIIFLPLSFMSSVFGMNASNFDAPGPNGGNKMSLEDQFKLLFPISIGATVIIMMTISLALSAWIRSVIYYAITVSWAYFIEYTYIRRIVLWVTTSLLGVHDSTEVYLAQKRRIGKIHAKLENKKLMEAMKTAGLLAESGTSRAKFLKRIRRKKARYEDDIEGL